MRALIALTFLIPLTALGEGLVLSDAWSRATVPGARAGAVYGVLTNESEAPLSLDGIESSVAGVAELHMTQMEGGMMRMRHADDIVLAPGERLVLEPGGFHIMLMGLKRGLSEGETIDLTIMVDSAAALEATVPVGSIGQMSPP